MYARLGLSSRGDLLTMRECSSNNEAIDGREDCIEKITLQSKGFRSDFIFFKFVLRVEDGEVTVGL